MASARDTFSSGAADPYTGPCDTGQEWNPRLQIVDSTNTVLVPHATSILGIDGSGRLYDPHTTADRTNWVTMLHTAPDVLMSVDIVVLPAPGESGQLYARVPFGSDQAFIRAMLYASSVPANGYYLFLQHIGIIGAGDIDGPASLGTGISTGTLTLSCLGTQIEASYGGITIGGSDGTDPEAHRHGVGIGKTAAGVPAVRLDNFECLDVNRWELGAYRIG